MKRRRWLLLFVPALAATAVGARVLQPPEIGVVPVVRGTSISAVYASGGVEPLDRVDVAARISGEILELPFREGDAVQKGAVLARVSAPTLGFEVTRAQADDTAASARLDVGPSIEALRAHRAALKAQLTQAEGELARVTALQESGSTGMAEVERSRAQTEALRAQIKGSEAQEHDLSIALKADAKRQRAVLDTARSKFGDTEVRSPLSGTVMSRRVDVGQFVTTNQVLLRVGDLSRLHLEVDVDEADIADVRIDQEAVIRLYAMRDRVIEGRVAKIHPEADRERKAFRVEIALAEDEKVEGLYPGMTAEVNIVLARHDNVLLAPLESVREDPHAGTRRIWVVEGGRVRDRVVTVKQRDLLYAEIEGLDEGAQVVVGDDAGLKDGARVRIRPAELGKAPMAEPSGAVSSTSP
jgi:multidrug efflux pump subunit AcrA (membrane-fusion protein)